MPISYFETEEELDEAFENEMDTMQEEALLNAAIEEAEQRVDDARDALREADEDEEEALREELEDAEQELEDLRKQLEALRDA